MKTIEEINLKVSADMRQLRKQMNSINGPLARFVMQMTKGSNAVKSNEAVVNRASKAYARHERTIKRINKTHNDTRLSTAQRNAAVSTSFDRLSNSIEKTGLTMNAAKTNWMAFSGELLSVMFFGMQMKKTFTAALGAIFEGYKKIIPEGHAFNKMTTKLSANWEFFKFQLADAMANSKLFQTFIQYAISLVQWFQGLSTTTKKWIVILTAVGVVVGSILFSVGVIGLGLLGITSTAQALAAAGGFGGVLTVIKNIGGKDGLGRVLSKARTLLTLKWSDIGSAIKNIGSKAFTAGSNLGGWAKKLNKANFLNALKKMKSGLASFSTGAVGSATILGLAMLAAYKTSVAGVELLDKEYVSTWAAIQGTVLDATVGIIGFIAAIPIAMVSTGQELIKAAGEIGDSARDAMLMGFSGISWGQALKSFKNDMDDIDLFYNIGENFAQKYADIGQFQIDLKEDLGLVTDIDNTTDSMTKLNEEAQKFRDRLNEIQDENTQFSSKLDSSSSSFFSDKSGPSSRVTNVYVDGINQSMTDDDRRTADDFKNILIGERINIGGGY